MGKEPEMRCRKILLAAAVLFSTTLASADLIELYNGYDSIWEIAVSGLRSSYFADTVAGLPVSGPTTSVDLPIFGPQRVAYPSGIGEVPSPGGTIGANFDQAVLGVRVDDGTLSVLLATALDPLRGYYHTGWKSWYGQGDLFLDVADSRGITHYALLNTWARDDEGEPLSLNGGHFNSARKFHLKGGTANTSLEGHLVRLQTDADVTLTGGKGAYTADNAPTGLDIRAYAEGGLDLGYANLTHSSIFDLGRTWYIQRWTVDLNALAADQNFQVTMHAVASCGNDQIGGSFMVPEPSALLLVLAGFASLLRYRRPN